MMMIIKKYFQQEATEDGIRQKDVFFYLHIITKTIMTRRTILQE